VSLTVLLGVALGCVAVLGFVAVFGCVAVRDAARDAALLGVTLGTPLDGAALGVADEGVDTWEENVVG